MNLLLFIRDECTMGKFITKYSRIHEERKIAMGRSGPIVTTTDRMICECTIPMIDYII